MDECKQCAAAIEQSVRGRRRKYCEACLRLHKREQHQRRVAKLTADERRERVRRDHANMRRCSVDGCGRSGPYRGVLCNMHRRRIDRYGSVNPKVEFRCAGCGEKFEVPRRKGAPPTRCDECRAAYNRDFRLQKIYGMTRADYEAMFSVQGRACAICQASIPGGTGWHIDHDHSTGVIRGILCGKCNTGLGLFRDEPELLRAAGDYIDSRRVDIRLAV